MRTATLRPALAAHAATQHGLVTRAQAVACGYTERELRTLTRVNGPWTVVRRGVYIDSSIWAAAGADERYRLRVHAALLNTRHPVLLSHQSAAAIHGLPMLSSLHDLVHVTRPGVLGGRTECGVKHHPAAVPQADRTVVDGAPCTSLARTAIDIGREHGYRHGLIAADQVRRREVPASELARVVEGMRYWPGITQARPLVDDADPGAHNLGETLARELVLELGLGPVQTQFEVTDGFRTAYADLRVRWHLFEFDGRVKYRRDRPYADDRDLEDVLWDEKTREDWLRSRGYGVSRLVWADVLGQGRRAALERLRREVMATQRRVGMAAWLSA